ncbi:MAG: FG-GAP-like repeat-containing protein [Candidatus Omnitrophota bacterium]
MSKLSFILISLFAASLFLTPANMAEASSNLNRLRALGQAYMEEEDFPKAIEAYGQAAALVPQSASDAINLGIAHYHGEKEEESIQLLKKALAMSPDNPFAYYTLGLAYKKIGDSTHAVECFRLVVEKDAADPASLYNYALSLSQLKRDQEAAPWYEKIIQHDPKHSSSYYQLLLYYSRQRDMQRAAELQKKFRELKQTEEQRPPDAVDEGKFLGPIEFDIAKEDLPKFTTDIQVQFVPDKIRQEYLVKALDGASCRLLALLSQSQVRQTTAVVCAKTGAAFLLTLSDKGEALTKTPLPNGNWWGCAAADYDNDDDIDLVLYSPGQLVLLRREADGSFKDVGKESGIMAIGANEAIWADIDHEGDLDLIVASAKGDAIFQNNGAGGFVGAKGLIGVGGFVGPGGYVGPDGFVGAGGAVGPGGVGSVGMSFEGLDPAQSLSIAVSDLDYDNDLDLVRLTLGKLEIYSNERQLRFKKRLSVPLERNSHTPSSRLLCRDFDNNGRMDIAWTGDSSPESIVWQVQPDWSLQPLEAFKKNRQMEYSKLLTAFDGDNDGYEDLFFTIPSLFACNQYPLDMKFTLLEKLDKKIYFKTALAADLDFDGDLDLLTVDSNGAIIPFENKGGNQNNWLTVKINGKKNAIDGCGSKILLKDDLFRVNREVATPFTHIGIGARSQADVLRLTWPNGIFQNVIHAQANQNIVIDEKPGYIGSCPFVYAWNGKQFEFIADSLCVAPIGLYVGGGFFPPRPEEYIRLRGDQLKPIDGKFEFRILEEMPEITYLDKLELLTIEHPPEMEVYSSDKFTVPPFPEFQLYGVSQEARAPRRVVDNLGQDATELIRENDHRYPRPWKSGRYESVNEEYWFEIDLNDFKDAKTLFLFMTGYVDWPCSSTARALEQNPEFNFVMPYLQTKNEKGEWQTVMKSMGFPAGKLKTVAIDLSNAFLTSDRSIRIVSTLQIHWDRILADPSPITEGFQIHKQELTSADLHYGGYTQTYDLDGAGPQWHDYNRRSSNSRWLYQLGAYTRYGGVLPLLQEFDDQYIIMQHGDEIAAQFAAAPERKDKGTTYFLHFCGWVKDFDYSTAHGVTVGPLPFKAMTVYPYSPDEAYPLNEENLKYTLEYNTRIYAKPNESLTIPRVVAAPGATLPSR